MVQLRWALELEVCDGEAEAMAEGSLPCPIPVRVIHSLLRCRDHLSEEHYHVVWSDEEGLEEWEAKVVGRTPHGDYMYHVRLC